MKISRFISGQEAMRRRFTFSLLCGAIVATVPSAGAQNRVGTKPAAGGSPVAAPRLDVPGVTLPAPGTVVATAPDINILVLALDSLLAPEATLPPLPPPPIILPAPAAGAITPASTALTFEAPVWMAQAQKKPKPDKDADLFRLAPETGSLLPGARTPALPGTAPGTASATASATAPGVPFVPGAPASPVAPAAGGFNFPDASLPPGRAQLTAVTLRRALMALGWNDVLTASPDSTAISRAIGERRLTPRTLDSLKRAVSQLAEPGGAPSAQATQSALGAAARIGQTLGYRAVVVLYVAPAATQAQNRQAAFSLVLCDSARESGEPILFDEKGQDDLSLRDAGASTAAALLDKSLRGWPLTASLDRAGLAKKHLDTARTQLAAGNTSEAQEELIQAVALDSSRAEPYVMLGDVLATSDPVGAASAYRRAVELNARDGLTWTKIAVALGNSTPPDWPRSLEAGRQALAANYDSAELRVAMATAQFGRADLFRRADRTDRAEDAEQEARTHLDRALELAPDDAGAVRLLAGRLVEARRFTEATQTLDRVAPRYPNDLDIQSQYAAALVAQTGREEDAFAAYSRVWKLSGLGTVDVDPLIYRTLMQGFDLRVYNLGKSAVQLTTGVANGALPREDALIQLTKLKEDMDLTSNAISILRPPASVMPEGAASRTFAADLMSQALEAQQIYLETGQDLQRTRGAQLNSQAVARLNAARGGR